MYTHVTSSSVPRCFADVTAVSLQCNRTINIVDV